MTRQAPARRIGRLTALLAASILSSSCSTFPGFRPLSYASPGEARVFASPDACPHEPAPKPEAAAILGAILTGAASQLLTNFGTAMSEAAKGGALPSSVATLNMTLPPNAVPRCLLIVRGSFEPNGQRVPMESKFDNLTQTQQQALSSRLAAFNIPEVYRLDHLIEIVISPAPNNKALSFAAIFARIDRSLDESQEGSRDFSVKVEFLRIGASNAVGSVVLIPDRQIGKAADATQRHDVTKRFPREAPWFGTFHNVSAPSTPPASGADSPAPPVVLTTVFDQSPQAVPVTVTTTVVETRPTREGLAFIASLFNSVKPKIEEALKPILNPSVKVEEDIKQQTAELTGDADHEAVLTAAKLAVLAYCEAASSDAAAAGKQDRLTKSSAARVAQINANSSAVKYGKPGVPYLSYITVSTDRVPSPCP